MVESVGSGETNLRSHRAGPADGMDRVCFYRLCVFLQACVFLRPCRDTDAVDDNRVCLYRLKEVKGSVYNEKVSFSAACTTC